ncbi:hypothetical protein Pd630_LPD09030 (plasmid) [Rhodococcus opacus PD630]|nr:hypothetical protein Pd630_LPD09030 [Rhodococcus opacus PD630]
MHRPGNSPNREAVRGFLPRWPRCLPNRRLSPRDTAVRSTAGEIEAAGGAAGSACNNE